ncbi:hypothetical protein SAMN05446927_5265 [Caballeronia arationis]|uniref:Uncharacterized protein n=1 Tax=Caballeronia arationis TaxID=1777142 RepID=A0A7Z7IA56_9BURK|nr:hypothetical protein [Caballeronia arationis]SOE81963.1 hypothetical protein SAMN05446927_5265 [Caballeronia arationis]
MKEVKNDERIIVLIDGELCCPSEDERKERADILKNYRAEIDKRHISNAENFDKAVLTYSSAGLAFSVGFFKDFFLTKASGFPVLLAVSWLSFTAAILMVGLSYVLSQKALKDQLARAERVLILFDEKDGLESPWVIWSDRITLFAGALFCCGVITTVLFPIMNHLPPHAKDTALKMPVVGKQPMFTGPCVTQP